jgi:Spy/CpxP family protein refolding chaperone
MNNTLRNILIAIVSIALIGLSISAFAHSGMGWGGGWGHHGNGWHHQGGYGSGYTDQLSKEEYAQLEQKREVFFEETQDIRDNLYDKGRQLENELAKSEPDAAKASKLQKEISKLQAQLDQKQVESMVEMRKQNPNAGSSYMYGGRMMRDRSYRGGYCWQ